MGAEKSGPSFASILTIVSIVIYTGGLVRIELKFNKQKEKIHELESVVESMKTSKNDVARVYTILRNRRSDYSMKNKTENKHTPDERFTSDNLVSELRQKLCQSNIDRCSRGPSGPPGPPGQRGERGDRGRRGNKGRTGNKGDNGIMGPPGRSGRQGIMGPPGSKGETGLKGMKGHTGTAGMKGAKGEPGESIAAPTVVVSPAKMTVNESKTASFQCSVSGNPKPVSTWSKLEGKSEKNLSATTDGKLILPNAAGGDSGLYKCSASNILGQAQALVQLVVNVHPRISLNPGPRYAIKGNTFTLPTCHVTGYPTPVVTWRKLSSQLPQGRVRYNNALQISQVRKEDSDTYICSAKNLLGKAEKNTMLVVVSLPRFTSKPSSKIVSMFNSTVRLNCSATGHPQPIISWRKPGGQLPVGRSQQINGALVIRNFQQSDAGNYICTATSAGVFDVKAVTFLEIQRAFPASSCNEIFQKLRTAKSQVFTLMLGSRNIPVYCHMGDFGCGSGGWTPVMKTDGTKKTFHYSSGFWRDKNVYNLAGGKTGFDNQETKLPSYWETRFSKICLGMRSGLTTRFVVIDRSSISLYALIADGTYRALSLGRNKWKSLIGSQASLQRNCNKQGFNVLSGRRIHTKARIGIIANQENHCFSCDSRIGFGTGGSHDNSNTCGNHATHSPDNGNKHIKAMGYILVQ
ncbi:receptor-type tyrosine-protein phosphatase F-like isoform X1 [Acropora millepora]|uniref:receptor-type tyrosine-protein phosphatase F-like isoform X1 n=1 Tax=Acropora millepora TaxID=45264 RepID=UPI001CF5EF34|nr:receptor-type tyrosine-protein phosphatase F-like isoform X1 [Acropora millepora]